MPTTAPDATSQAVPWLIAAGSAWAAVTKGVAPTDRAKLIALGMLIGAVVYLSAPLREIAETVKHTDRMTEKIAMRLGVPTTSLSDAVHLVRVRIADLP